MTDERQEPESGGAAGDRADSSIGAAKARVTRLADRNPIDHATTRRMVLLEVSARRALTVAHPTNTNALSGRVTHERALTVIVRQPNCERRWRPCHHNGPIAFTYVLG